MRKNAKNRPPQSNAALGRHLLVMKRFLIALVVTLALAPACSAGQATSNVATLDAPALQACRDLRAVIQARAAGGLATANLRARLGQVYNEASGSVNPIIKAKAVALFADATEMASGGEGRSLTADLASMLQTCSGVSS
jgi:hypothetical protein